MIDAGDIHLADVNQETRWQVLVISTPRFHELSGRALVAPQYTGPLTTIPFPWRITIDGHVYALDLLRTVSIDRLLDRVGRANLEAMLNVRRAITQLV